MALALLSLTFLYVMVNIAGVFTAVAVVKTAYVRN